MISSFRRQLLHFRDQVDAMVESILVCSDQDLDRPLELKFGDRPFRTNLRSAIRYTIEEYRVHEGQIAGNQFLVETLRATSSEGEVAAFTPYDRSEAAWLAAELYVAAACLISRLVGYPDQWVDEHPKEDEWSIKEIVEHLIRMERSGEWSLGQLAVKAREARHDFNSSPLR